jgi:hypothetical protein
MSFNDIFRNHWQIRKKDSLDSNLAWRQTMPYWAIYQISARGRDKFGDILCIDKNEGLHWVYNSSMACQCIALLMDMLERHASSYVLWKLEASSYHLEITRSFGSKAVSTPFYAYVDLVSSLETAILLQALVEKTTTRWSSIHTGTWYKFRNHNDA